jgi:hypothetical protein
MNQRLIDRRRSKRIGVVLPVILENATAVTRDASASGVFFWKRGTFMFEDAIRFSIERNTESGRILQKCRGVVVRTEPDDDGVGVAARIVESTTERVPGHPAGPEMPDSAREEPPTIAPPAEDTPASAEKTAVLDSAREEPPTIVPPTDDATAPAEKTPLLESVPEQAPTIAWPTDEALFSPDRTISLDTARERLPTIAWPTDEAFFSPDRTERLDTAREQPPTNTQPFDSAAASANETPSLDFVQEQPRAVTRPKDDPLASAIETINRWSTLLRGMALDARDEFQGQELLEWDIPPAANAMTARSPRVTVCSVNVVGLRPGESRVRGNSRVLAVSYWDLARLRARGGFKARRNAGAAGVGEDSQFLNRRNPRDGRGVRIELAIVANGSPGDRTAGKTLLPKIVVRTTSVPDSHQQGLDTYCYEEASYGDPREAFEAFLGVAGESAILINLDLPDT